ncbi:MAG: hypothetical protein PF961_23000 [Planctomycetota bacterium]|jgi:uroporphyrinogen decarboxylase|nr:hypothetical protein [Planctomycetota bacterium]
MRRRDRVLAALNHSQPDRVPKDLGGMRSTGISCFAYPQLRTALNLPARRPLIHDTSQMLALPEEDVLDALDCDVLCVEGNGLCAPFAHEFAWHDYDFNGRLPAQVLNPAAFRVDEAGCIHQGSGEHASRMPSASHVFETAHGGQPLDFNAEIEPWDLDALRANLRAQLPEQAELDALEQYCQRLRQHSDRAIMLSGPTHGFGFHGGIAAWSMRCALDPDSVKDIHAVITELTLERMQRVIPRVAPYIDVLMASADDHGTQSATFLAPATYRDLYLPYQSQVNNCIHSLAPDLKIFLHSCGAIYEIIEHIIAAGFDVLNPVQWCAGTRGYQEWKDLCRGRIALWGGGVNTQHTVPRGNIAEITNEIREVVAYLAQDGGYVFTPIHNLLAEVPAEVAIAIYRTAGAVPVNA